MRRREIAKAWFLVYPELYFNDANLWLGRACCFISLSFACKLNEVSKFLSFYIETFCTNIYTTSAIYTEKYLLIRINLLFIFFKFNNLEYYKLERNLQYIY